MKFLIPILLCAAILALSGCTCPPKNADGTKPPCRWWGPSISGVVGWQGVSLGLTVFGEAPPKAPTVEIPINVHDPLPLHSK